MTNSQHKVLVANRGEIAVRVVRAAHELGWQAVAVHSEADADALWVRLADAAVDLGPSQATKSYLVPEKLVDAAVSTGCDLVHPGYGFLSERSSFVRALDDAGLTFVGPSADVIDKMGDKAVARQTAESAGVPVVPGSGIVADVDEASRVADELGYPVLVKASAGGGGRGIRVVPSADELALAVTTAQNEARAAFGDGDVYLEKAIVNARHIEVQIMADTHGHITHAWERDCSVQRRRQKLIEEAPAAGLDRELREQMTDAAVRLAAEVGYVGAGTVEFLVDADGFYFIEMNTRIQVEHPITEVVTDVDLVAEQLRVAAGLELSFQAPEVRGVAFELRINAEDPDNDFFPSPGVLERFDLPGGPGVRVETGFAAGATVPPYYDSLLAKLVVEGLTRGQAVARALQALDELQVEGVTTTASVHRHLLRDSAVALGPVSTTWLEEYLGER